MSLLKRLLCEHEYVFVRNVYGDEINAMGGYRSVWRCKRCGKQVYSYELHDEDKHKREVD